MDFGQPNVEIGRKMTNGQLISSTANQSSRSLEQETAPSEV